MSDQFFSSYGLVYTLFWNVVFVCVITLCSGHFRLYRGSGPSNSLRPTLNLPTHLKFICPSLVRFTTPPRHLRFWVCPLTRCASPFCLVPTTRRSSWPAVPSPTGPFVTRRGRTGRRSPGPSRRVIDLPFTLTFSRSQGILTCVNHFEPGRRSSGANRFGEGGPPAGVVLPITKRKTSTQK